MASTLGLGIDDIAECSICMELYDNPKLLSCAHTFCCKCLERHATEKKPVTDTNSCPLCRQQFTIPTGGIDQLPGNYLIAKLVELRKRSIQEVKEAMMCDICTEKTEIDISKVVKWYCPNCDEKLCIQCAKNHQRARTTKLHQLTEIEKRKEIMNMNTPSFCEQHPDKQLELYCHDCKNVICLMCFAVGHKTHNTDDINMKAKEVRAKFQHDANKVKERNERYRREKENCHIERENFLKDVAENEMKICSKMKELIQLVNSHGNHLLQELQCIKENTLKQFKTNEYEIDRQMLMLESFGKYSQEMIDKATAFDIVRISDDLQSKAAELHDMPIITVLSAIEILFSSQDVVEEITSEKFNIVGIITPVNYPAGQGISRYLSAFEFFLIYKQWQ